MVLIKLDIDDTWGIVKLVFNQRGWVFEKIGKINSLQVYQTKRGYHIIVDIQAKMKQWEIILVQIIAYSDINREILNYLRLRKYGDAKNHTFLIVDNSIFHD